MSLIIGWLGQPFAGTTVLQTGFFDSFFSFVTHDTGDRQVFAGYTHIDTGYIASGRDEMCRKFLTTDADWLLMVDWDVTFTPEAVYALLDAADPTNRPIIAGCYVTFFGSDAQLRPCWMVSKDGEDYVPPTTLDVGEIIECSMVGMGFTLIHRKVLETLGLLYREDPWHWFGHDIINNSRVGEDLTFCSRARKAGFTVWGHGGVLLGHTKCKTFIPSDIADASMAFPRPLATGTMKRLLNVGGGTKNDIPAYYSGWQQVLLDVAGNPQVDLVMDACKLAESTEVEDDSFDAIYCSHMLEHIYAHEVARVLAGFMRVLKPGARLEIRTPDLTPIMTALAEGKALDDEAYISPAGPITYRDVLFGYGPEIERSGQDHYAHRNGFTKTQMTKELETAGFRDVQMVDVQPELFEVWVTAVKPVGTSDVKPEAG